MLCFIKACCLRSTYLLLQQYSDSLLRGLIINKDNSSAYAYYMINSKPTNVKSIPGYKMHIYLNYD